MADTADERDADQRRAEQRGAEPRPAEERAADQEGAEPGRAEKRGADERSGHVTATEAGATTEQRYTAQRDREASRSLLRNLIWLVGLGALVIGLLLAVPGLRDVGHTVSNMSLSWLIAGVALEILSCAGYILCFLQVFDRAPVRLGARVALTELAFNSAVSLGGVGSVAVGAWLLVERGGDPKQVAERSGVLFLLTTAINVLTLIAAGFLLWIGVLPGNRNPWLSLFPAAFCTVAFLVVLAIPRYSERLAARRRPGKLRTLLEETAITIRLTEQVLFAWDWRIIGAIAYLWCDIAVLGVCFAAAGAVPPIAVLVLAYQIGYLSNVIPVPGGIGVLDGSLVGMFALYGGTAASLATAATVVYHAISLWVPALWGTIAFLILQRSRDRPITLRPPRSERRALKRRRKQAAGGD
jgi:uncharacterized membrane protein YbhN (UPF0104 family)